MEDGVSEMGVGVGGCALTASGGGTRRILSSGV
jgi:hypothetical protein